MVEEKKCSKDKLIMEAALTIFAEKGFHRARIDDIAHLAGIGKGTVYEYFRSKEELFRETLKNRMNTYNKMLEKELGKGKNTREKLEIYIRQNMQITSSVHSLAKIALMETKIVDDRFRESLKEMHYMRVKLLQGVIEKGIANKEIKPVNAEILALLFYGGIGFMLNPFLELSTNKVEKDSCVKEVVDYYLEGVKYSEESRNE